MVYSPAIGAGCCATHSHHTLPSPHSAPRECVHIIYSRCLCVWWKSNTRKRVASSKTLWRAARLLSKIGANSLTNICLENMSIERINDGVGRGSRSCGSAQQPVSAEEHRSVAMLDNSIELYVHVVDQVRATQREQIVHVFQTLSLARTAPEPCVNHRLFRANGRSRSFAPRAFGPPFDAFQK